MSDLQTLVAQEVDKQLAIFTADATVKKVLNYLKNNGGGSSKVVEEWHEGTEWYRVWSSGLIEQGGYNPEGAREDRTITFHKEFTQTPYLSFSHSLVNDATYGAMSGWCPKRVTPTGFTFMSLQSGVTYGMFWYAIGY